ncbi:MAG: carboxylesterase/lipase family protein [Lacunisphaera sp.]|nr:carboxylesterase/lipase family protein [Lacunisphaera sp.]
MTIHRRDFIKTVGAGCIGAGIGLSSAVKVFGSDAADDEAVIVDTKYGKLKGRMNRGCAVFKGVPYAGPSDGDNRFLPPTPLAPWAGIREAIVYGPKSYQSVPKTGVGMSENCQFVDIWAPTIKSSRKLPVMFWCHGGGFTSGAGSDPFFNGRDMVKNGEVVLVTVTHRLGALGFLYLGHLDKKYAQSGNAGMLDIVAALQWVRENIAGFGGDPGNVTLFGQSGGGGKVTTLLGMPSATGLFHKAISQSGAFFAAPSEEAGKSTDDIFRNLGIKPGDIAALLKVAPMTLIEKSSVPFSADGPSSGRSGIGFLPVVDGLALPNDPYDPVAPAMSANIPLIIGSNKDEMGRAMTDEKLILDAIRKRAGDKTDQLIAAYKKYYPDYSLPDIYSVFVADTVFHMAAIRAAERKVAQPAPVYMYRFDYGVVPPGGANPRSAHSMELPFVFNHTSIMPQFIRGAVVNDEVISLARNMSMAWMTFAHHGNPNHTGLIHWPTYDLKDRATMVFNLECQVQIDPLKDVREILTGLPPP